MDGWMKIQENSDLAKKCKILKRWHMNLENRLCSASGEGRRERTDSMLLEALIIKKNCVIIRVAIGLLLS